MLYSNGDNNLQSLRSGNHVLKLASPLDPVPSQRDLVSKFKQDTNFPSVTSFYATLR